MSDAYDGMAFTFKNRKMFLVDLCYTCNDKIIAKFANKAKSEQLLNVAAKALLYIENNNKEIKSALEFACFDV